MQNNDDETAFPVAIGQTAADMKGMSLRDWFAGQVLVGMYQNCLYDQMTSESIAQHCYRQAQEMMEARKTLG